MKRFVYTPAMRAWLRINYMLPLPQLTSMFNTAFGTNRTKEAINGFRKNLNLKTGRSGQFATGNKPFNAGTKGVMKANAGSFKKGQLPHNHLPVGSEILNKEGYLEIKIAEPDQWKFKHRLLWEQANGEIPVGMIVSFLDDNRLNCRLDNLELVSRQDHAVFNRWYGNTPTEYKKIGRSIVALRRTVAQKQKETDR
ncbi:HNH endonuclease signature motif containing protein [Limnobaculum xujianqingii]|uniref:HNH endonuclease signature motif containing protein n=1 Tax=Limnobaculum xujianqingii TaxID=2738837 RepID=UPI001129CE5A|nr:HNH endonuclease signature motif containing protein [Limnobaculum xujianqingii]